MPEKSEKDFELEALRDFYKNLSRHAAHIPWDESVKVNRNTYSPQDGSLLFSYPPVFVEIGPQIAKHGPTWQILTDRLFVTTEKNPRKFRTSLREPAMQKFTLETSLSDNAKEEGLTDDSVYMALRYSSVEAIADLEPKDTHHYSPVPEEGRPQLKFKFTDIYNSSRVFLTELHSQLEDTSAEALDIQILTKMRSRESAISTSLPIAEVLPIVQSTPLSVIEVVYRTTHYDLEKSDVQPANIAGFRITQTLDSHLICERLMPWVNYNSWERLNLDEKNMGVVFESHLELIDRNLGYLANAVSLA